MSPSAMPSMVLTSAPSACTARTVQLLTASPSRCTVHAPQLVVSQPDMGAGQAQGVAQQVHEQQSRLDLDLMLLAVDGEAHGNSAHASPLSLDAGCREPITSRCACTSVERARARLSGLLLRRGVAEHDALGGVGGALDERPHLVAGSAFQRPRTYAETMSGSVESGRPTPTRTRTKSGEPRPRRRDFRPLWPARPPPDARANLAEGQVDLVVHDEHAVELEVQRPARRAGRVAGLVHVGLRATARPRAGRRGRCGRR